MSLNQIGISIFNILSWLRRNSVRVSNLMTLFLLLIVCLPNPSKAEIDLYVLRPTSNHERFIIPVQRGESFNSALQNYKNLISANTDLNQLVSTENLRQFSTGQVYQLQNDNVAKVLMLANNGYDLEPSPIDVSTGRNRVRKIVEKIADSAEVYILPVASAITLNAKDKLDFFEKLNSLFSGVIVLGGADIDPDLYNEKLEMSRNVNSTRDKYEIEFLKKWIEFKKGFLFGICRGHQAIAVALGFKLEQHISDHGDGLWAQHKIQLAKTRSGFFSRIMGKGVSAVKVNSYHHQAVRYSQNDYVDVAAYADDGTVEALESIDGRILTTQFHPEFMEEAVSKKIFSFLKRTLISRNKKMCSRLF